jgi:hypothetical protein
VRNISKETDEILKRFSEYLRKECEDLKSALELSIKDGEIKTPKELGVYTRLRSSEELFLF